MSLRLVLCCLLAFALPAAAQDGAADPAGRATASSPSPRKALGLSLLVPGLGQRYVQEGSWRGMATAYVLADAAALLGFVGTRAYRAGLVNDYETLAAARADAEIAGKDRQFFLNLATYRSSDEYLDVQLRTRNWGAVDYVDAPGYQWEWATEEDFIRYREMREDAESLGRRGTFLVGVLIANRLVSGLNALRGANRADRSDPALQLRFAPAPEGTFVPVLNLELRF